jgi:hypothetical protein
MPIFKLNRNHTLRSLYGHVVTFKKDEDTFVPNIVVNECVAIGAVQVDGTPDVLGPEEKTEKPLSPAEREAAILAAFDKLVATNDREDFTGSGLPSDKAVERETGFKVDTKERNSLWNKRREQMAG